MYNYILKRIMAHSKVIQEVKEGKRIKNERCMSLGSLVELQFLIDYADLTTIERNELRLLIRTAIEGQ